VKLPPLSNDAVDSPLARIRSPRLVTAEALSFKLTAVNFNGMPGVRR